MGKGFKPTLSQMQAYMDTIKRADSHFSYLLACDTMMFEYAGLPETIDQTYLEQYLNISGIAAIGYPINSDGLPSSFLYAAPFASRNGQLNQYGIGTECNAFVPNGENIRGTIGEDVAIIYNNTNHTPQTDLFFDTQLFTEIDKSVNSNVLFARIAPIFSTSDDKTKEQIKAVIENVISGNLETVVSENLLDMFGLQTGTETVKILDVFQHPERVQYVQYLSQLFDVIMRRHFSRRGLSIKTPTKAAQQSTDEIHGMDSVSWFYPLNKLKARRDGIEMVNRIFGTSITVDFSEIWRQEFAAYQLRLLQDDVQAENDVKGDESDVVSDSGISGADKDNAAVV